MRLLVTGGAGFIGSNYVRRIVDGSLPGVSQLTVLDKLTYAGTLTNLDMLPKGSFEFVKGDICNLEQVQRLMAKTDAVVHFAAESHVDRSIMGAKAFFETNVLGTQNLLDSALRNEVKTFVQVSTDEVYGTISDGSWHEEFPLLPNSPYSASKASADLVARAYNRTFDLDVRITRCSNNYGPHQYPEKIISLFVTNLIDNKKVPLYGLGLNVRDWLHVDDHCQGIHKVLFSESPGEIFNIGGGEELSNLEITRLILHEMSQDESLIELVDDRLGHDFRYSVNCRKIEEELGYKPRINFKTGLKDTIKWYVDNPSWWNPLVSP